MAFGREDRDKMNNLTPLLLVPGLLCDAALWAPQVEALADLARPIVADVTRSDSIGGMAADALAQAPERFALAGLSMGGYVAQEIMRRVPGRVTRLALLDTSARADTPEQSARRRDMIALAKMGTFKGVTPRLLPYLLHPARLDDKPLVETVMGMAERVGRDAFLRQEEAIIGRVDGRADLGRIACPTLILCGAQDLLIPPELHREMASLVPGAKLVEVPDCGHLSTLERPEAVNAALRDWVTG